ncbi:MAG: hypothetical protein KKH83_08625 [Candidatus Margulisbacteria bacterium]|nr:hypothetical protein [Candidatus Margulisiibacteriota bacterium]
MKQFALFPLFEQEKYLFRNRIEGILKSMITNQNNLTFSKEMRLYVGSESCENLMPSRETLAKYIRLGQERSVSICLVTPFMITPTGSARLSVLLGLMNDRAAKKSEVIINDWGALEMLQKYPRLVPVIGRALNKMRRSVNPLAETKLLPYRSLFGISILSNPAICKFLKEKKVKAFGYDNLWHGIAPSKSACHDLKTHLYFPLIPVSFTSNCLFASTNREENDKFRCGLSCKRECQEYYVANSSYFDANNKSNLLMLSRGIYGCNNSLEGIPLKDFDRLVYVLH